MAHAPAALWDMHTLLFCQELLSRLLRAEGLGSSKGKG